MKAGIVYFRYDGIYKVVKYFPAIGQTGLVVWKYLMRRDDPEPAPWTEEGKRIIEEKDLRVIVSMVTHFDPHFGNFIYM